MFIDQVLKLIAGHDVNSKRITYTINPNIYVLRIVAASFLIPNPFFSIKKIERIAWPRQSEVTPKNKKSIKRNSKLDRNELQNRDKGSLVQNKNCTQ